ncbi:amidase [Nocardiopsis gilva YIM 90087]|uniref:Amidase n=1 Tax=Nocardiopsis gilva YIM 90087 TaxID=1235441 RepID=A0A223S6Z7_9ACTN|nr:amidase [Nocardiopsis gilva]ASU83872.1 amidase [Nocardiopsis gilva YIM 90087]
MTTSADLHYTDATDLARMLRRREVSAREVVRAHLDRIAAVNAEINAVVTLDAERAMEEAAQADARLAGGGVVGPLHGIPVAVKDTHDTAGIRTTYGSPVFANHVPEHDALTVERMRAAGAIVMGKTNAPEFGTGSHTFNPVFGVTRNPYDTSLSAGGSTGGGAAALAAGLHPLLDGSDMGGSLRNPGSFNNVVGLRPSPGRVPQWPSILPWEPMTVAGPMARTVSDVALLMSVIAGPDPRAPMALTDSGAMFDAPLECDMRGLRVAYSADFGGDLPIEAEASVVVHAAAEVFAGLGCAVEEVSPDFSHSDRLFRTLRTWQFAVAYSWIVDEHPGQVKDALVEEIVRGRLLSAEDIGQAKLELADMYHRFREFFVEYDVLLLPVSQVLPFDAGLEYPTEVAGEPMDGYLRWMSSCYWVTTTLCPAMSVPAGFTPAGLPVGVQLVAKHRADLALLRYAYAFEQATRYAERRPELAPTT